MTFILPNLLVTSVTFAEKSCIFATVRTVIKVRSELSVFRVCDESIPGMPARKTLKLFNDVMSSSDNQISW